MRRSSRPARQCPQCWSRAIASRIQLRLASQLLKPWVYLLLEQQPPGLLPKEHDEFPFALLAFGSLMSKTHDNVIARLVLTRSLLKEAGFSPDSIELLAHRIARGGLPEN